ncbi:RIP metalloprotease RseP [Candidatus Parcubacteria bacterium]|nr:MAG: RIP metalloprotease RseP [Candidatus Parcubacteria bacterium]
MLTTLIVFILILGLLVLVHELGHFVTAKRAGVKVDEFGFGFPPRIIGFYKDNNRWRIAGPKTVQKESTIYSLNWVPLGGFVKIKGEQGEAAAEEDSFAHKGAAKRAWILSSGVLMNVILAVFLLSAGYYIGLPQILDENNLGQAKISEKKIQIVEVVDRLPAQKEGVQIGDTIITIDGNIFSAVTEIQSYLDSKAGQEVIFEVKREEQIITKKIVPQMMETGKAGIGVALVETALVSYPWYLALAHGFLTTLILAKAIIVAFFSLFKDLITSQKVMVDVAGPVGIAVLTGQVAKMGFIYILQFTALLSLNLAIINFAPFPALDGGRVLFIIIEKIKGRPVNQKVENFFHNLGFVLLMFLILLVTFRDISKISDIFSRIGNYIKNIIL